jgi:hypothetical protein
MHDFMQQPLQMSLLLLFLGWIAFGFWVITFTYIFKGSNSLPKWWKPLLITYVTTVLGVLMISYNVAANPEDIVLGATYGAFGLSVLSIPAAAVWLICRTVFRYYKSRQK